MKISEVLKRIGSRKIPTIQEESHIDNVIQVMADFIHTRIVYVVNRENKLVGTISVGSLLRHIYPHLYEEKIHPHGILNHITAETASNLMTKSCVSTTPDETVNKVFKRMVRSGVKEMAVLDKDGRIIGDITAIDLMQCNDLK